MRKFVADRVGSGIMTVGLMVFVVVILAFSVGMLLAQLM